MLAARALGSTEILLRSRDNGLALSQRLGSCFSTNGDMIGFCPTNFLESAKTRALQVAAAAVGKTAAPVSILVNFQPLADDKNHVGGPNLLRHVTTSLLEQAVSTPPPCVGCGDCVSGCNYSAKSTIIMNYLPDAKNHSAEIFTRLLPAGMYMAKSSTRTAAPNISANQKWPTELQRESALAT